MCVCVNPCLRFLCMFLQSCSFSCRGHIYYIGNRILYKEGEVIQEGGEYQVSSICIAQ